MYTQCPNCSTIFDATDEELGARQGRVRCGRCREVFNAPWNLVESLPAGDNDSTAPTHTSPPPGADSDATQKWTVSELDPAGGSSWLQARTKVPPLPRQLKPETGEEQSPLRMEPDLGIPRDIDEEIVIEAPTNLWNLDDEPEAMESEVGAAAESEDSAGPVRPGPRMIPIARHADDVKLVQIPHPKPIQSAAWVAAALILVAAVFWQLKQYYITDLAEVESLRDPLETICEYASCTVPPRTDIKRIDLVSTSVDPHPATPGALRVSANLINRATFVQPFPPLEVTLTNKEGAVVGRRTYLPHEYRSRPTGDMSPNVVERADLDLVQPAQSAVGYEIQLVAG